MLSYISKLSLSPHLQNALDTTRYNARLISMTVIQKALDVFNEESIKSGNLLYAAAQQLPRLSSYFLCPKKIWALRSLTTFCALQAFAAFDNKYVNVSDYCWNALLESQRASNILWHELTQTRALFYKTHYHTVYNTMQKYALEPQLLSHNV